MDRIARAVEPSMELPAQMPEARRGDDRRPRDVERRHAIWPRRSARARSSCRLHGSYRVRGARLRPRRPIAGLSHNQTAVQQMALEWGVLPMLMPRDRRRGSLGPHDREGAQGRHHRPGRPRRAHRRHRRQPPGLDQRDQGRRRLDANGGRIARRGGEGAPRCSRPTRLLALGALLLVASSTGSRCTPTSTRTRAAAVARPRWRGCEAQQCELEARIAPVGTGPCWCARRGGSGS